MHEHHKLVHGDFSYNCAARDYYRTADHARFALR